jgi:D-sedoheptulose 7-phosphate isomerase
MFRNKNEWNIVETEVKIRLNSIRDLILNDLTIYENQINSFIQILLDAVNCGNKIVFMGNGGSAAEATHLAAEFTGKCVVPHRPIAALCLNESFSAITAIGNDYGFNEIFTRQVEAHVKQGDIVVALSTSGRSQNILDALELAVKIEAKCYLWTGKVNLDIPGVEIWKVPSNSTPRIQEIHLMWGHIIAEVFEIMLTENP